MHLIILTMRCILLIWLLEIVRTGREGEKVKGWQASSVFSNINIHLHFAPGIIRAQVANFVEDGPLRRATSNLGVDSSF